MVASGLLSTSFRPSPLATTRPARSLNIVVRAQAEQGDGFSRRTFGSLLVGGGLLALTSSPSEAAFGEAAKVFGSKPTNATGFVPYKSNDYSLLLPSRWTPSNERDHPEVTLRYEDTFPANNILVYQAKTSKNSIREYGDPTKFLEEVNFLFGENSWQGASRSEGGFKANQMSKAALLDAETVKGKDGKDHLNLHVLIRSNDGNEGGRHHLINAAVSNGQLYIMKAQIGDKRWNRGGSRDSKVLQESFTLA